MNRRSCVSASILLAAFGALLSWSHLTAQDHKSQQTIPDGFRGDHVFIEKKDGGFVLLHRPEVRTLAGKTYLVGLTVSVKGVTEDELFDPMRQWVATDNIRRMGESNSESVASDICDIAVRLKIASVGK